MRYKTEIKKLKKLHSQKRYFEVISIGVQFIDFCSDKILELEKIPLEEIPNDELDEIESWTGYERREWKNLKKQIWDSLKRNDSWKYKIFRILDLTLEQCALTEIKVTSTLIQKIRSLHQARNEIQHEFYTKKFSLNFLEKKSKECLEICQLFDLPMRDYEQYQKTNTGLI